MKENLLRFSSYFFSLYIVLTVSSLRLQEGRTALDLVEEMSLLSLRNSGNRAGLLTRTLREIYTQIKIYGKCVNKPA